MFFAECGHEASACLQGGWGSKGCGGARRCKRGAGLKPKQQQVEIK